MAYTKKTWTTGEVLTATGMNNIENGIAANDEALSALNTDIDGKLDKPETEGTENQILALSADGKLIYIDKPKDGEQGPQGEKGEKGDVGQQGPQGEKGEKGEVMLDSKVHKEKKEKKVMLDSKVHKGRQVSKE